MDQQWEILKESNTHIIGAPGEETKIFEEIIDEKTTLCKL